MEGLFSFTDVQFLVLFLAPYSTDNIIFRFGLKINQGGICFSLVLSSGEEAA